MKSPGPKSTSASRVRSSPDACTSAGSAGGTSLPTGPQDKETTRGVSARRRMAHRLGNRYFIRHFLLWNASAAANLTAGRLNRLLVLHGDAQQSMGWSLASHRLHEHVCLTGIF